MSGPAQTLQEAPSNNQTRTSPYCCLDPYVRISPRVQSRESLCNHLKIWSWMQYLGAAHQLDMDIFAFFYPCKTALQWTAWDLEWKNTVSRSLHCCDILAAKCSDKGKKALMGHSYIPTWSSCWVLLWGHRNMLLSNEADIRAWWREIWAGQLRISRWRC